MKSKFSTSKTGGKTKLPKAFTEKGLYMLATILKSSIVTETTIAIIETFAKVKELSRTISHLPEETDKKLQKTMIERSGELMTDLMTDSFHTVSTEASLFQWTGTSRQAKIILLS